MTSLKDHLTEAMKNEFGDDLKRINHALAVLGHAENIMREEGGDAQIVTAAALLHDIGIQEAERKYGSSAGNYQEIEGPPIARRILESNGFEETAIVHICRIIGSHHSARDIDTLEFRIIWDSDWLVNIPDELPGIGREKLKTAIDRIFKTASGKKKAYELFMERKTE